MIPSAWKSSDKNRFAWFGLLSRAFCDREIFLALRERLEGTMIGPAKNPPARPFDRQLTVPGMQGGEVYGAEANAPTSGARTQLPSGLINVVAEVCRGAILLRAAEASLVYAAAATSAAATKIILVIVLSTW
jgi:hypothetical protein